jgi:hypothetical protein
MEAPVNDHPTLSPFGNGVWRVLVLDSSPDDPLWLICSVTMPTDVRPAEMDASSPRRYRGWEAVTEWVRAQVGPSVSLTPISAAAWRIDENGPRD